MSREKLPDAWHDLLVATPRAIEELTYFPRPDRTYQDIGGASIQVDRNAELAALARCDALPRLRALTVDDRPRYLRQWVSCLPRVLAGPVAKRLDVLGVIVEHLNAGSPLAVYDGVIRGAPVPELRFVVGLDYDTIELAFQRGATGYERLAITAQLSAKTEARSARLAAEITAILDGLPPTVQSRTIDTGRGMLDEHRAQLLGTVALSAPSRRRSRS
jgi:hypothetical protein